MMAGLMGGGRGCIPPIGGIMGGIIVFGPIPRPRQIPRAIMGPFSNDDWTPCLTKVTTAVRPVTLLPCSCSLHSAAASGDSNSTCTRAAGGKVSSSTTTTSNVRVVKKRFWKLDMDSCAINILSTFHRNDTMIMTATSQQSVNLPSPPSPSLSLSLFPWGRGRTPTTVFREAESRPYLSHALGLAIGPLLHELQPLEPPELAAHPLDIGIGGPPSQVGDVHR